MVLGAGTSDSPALSLSRRVSVLRGLAWLGSLSEPQLEALAKSLEQREAVAGTELVSEGDEAEHLFVLLSGRAEVWIPGPRGPVALALLEDGEVFGEMALLAPGGRRTATVTALEPTVVAALDIAVFTALLDAEPDARAAFESHVEQLFTARFIQLVAPFGGLDDAGRQWLAGRVKRTTFDTGCLIVRQGDRGDSCFIVLSGSAEILISDGSGVAQVRAEIGPRALFGESAVLGDAPRSASVRAAEPCEVLEIDRATLREAFERYGALRKTFASVMRSRDRPRRVDDVTVGERASSDGDTITVLKHPGRLAYYRVSARGRFVWDRLDGQHSMRELMLEYMRGFGEMAPHVVNELVAGLAAAGFVTVHSLSPEFAVEAGHTPSLLHRFSHRLAHALQWRVEIRGLDGPVSRVYERGVRSLYTRRAQIAMGLVAAAAVVLFVSLASGVSGTVHAHPGLILLLIPGYLLVVAVHESGHAFTTKAFGREVHKAGFGWYWFAPVFFVDTSDMWLGSRAQRVLVSLAGPYSTLVLAGPLMIAAALLPATPRAVLWMLALPIYLSVLLNLDPILEYDGYYVVTDLLDRPSLRREALARIRTVLRHPSAARGHWFDVGYGIAAIVYIAAMAAVVALVYNAVAERWLARVLPSAAAADLQWVLAALVAGVGAAGLWSEMRAASSSAPGSG